MYAVDINTEATEIRNWLVFENVTGKRRTKFLIMAVNGELMPNEGLYITVWMWDWSQDGGVFILLYTKRQQVKYYG